VISNGRVWCQTTSSTSEAIRHQIIAERNGADTKHVVRGQRIRMEVTPAIAVLVADSSAFIKGASLEAWSGNVVTVREVVSEIKDVNTRQRLQVLPYDLSFREPSQEALHHGESRLIIYECS